MEISNKNLMTRPTRSAHDYFRSGLVGLWDGIENYGFGQHREKLDKWKDLSGIGRDIVLQPEMHVCDDMTVFNGQFNMKLADSLQEIGNMKCLTIEAVGRVSVMFKNSSMITMIRTNDNTQKSAAIAFDSEVGVFLSRTFNYGWQSGIDSDIFSTLTVTTSIDKSSDLNYNMGKFYMNGKLMKVEDPASWIFSFYDSIGTQLRIVVPFGNQLEIKCIRMYLTDLPLQDEIINQNYEVDKKRFGI